MFQCIFVSLRYAQVLLNAVENIFRVPNEIMKLLT